MNHDDVTGTLDTMIIGGGQAGLAMGYYLKEQKRKFLILDENPRTGDSWRQRWDSLRVFTPAKYDGLPAAPFPADPLSFPPKDELADYLERYAVEFELPVRQGTRVERLWREGDRYIAASNGHRWEAKNVHPRSRNSLPCSTLQLSSCIRVSIGIQDSSGTVRSLLSDSGTPERRSA
jgi:putative flavoprotein involved in K+ transport